MNQTMLTIIIYQNGERQQFETSTAKTAREWSSTMRTIGSKLFVTPQRKSVACVVVIDGTNVANYNAVEAAEILGIG